MGTRRLGGEGPRRQTFTSARGNDRHTSGTRSNPDVSRSVLTVSATCSTPLQPSTLRTTSASAWMDAGSQDLADEEIVETTVDDEPTDLLIRLQVSRLTCSIRGRALFSHRGHRTPEASRRKTMACSSCATCGPPGVELQGEDHV